MSTTPPQLSPLGPDIIGHYDTVGGIDTISSSVNIGQTKLRDAQNINYFPIGGLQWRNGYLPLNNSPVSSDPCLGVYMARFSGGTNTAVLICGGKVYTMATLNGTWVDRTGSVVISGLETAPVNFAILNDIVCMSNGSNTCWQLNPSNVTQVIQGSPVFTSALFNVEYRGYMFWGNTVESSVPQYDRLRFSDVNNPNSFTMLGVNNYIDVARKSGGDLRGAVTYNTFLYLFKRHGIYQLTFQPTQVNSSGVVFPFSSNPNPVVENVGTQSHRSIVKFTTPITNKRQSGIELVFFVDQFGTPRIFDGKNTVQIGYPISQSRDSNIMSLASMDNVQLPYVWAINYPGRNQIWCFMSSKYGHGDTCWVLDYTTDFVWGRHKFNEEFASGALFETGTGSWTPYLGNYTGTVSRHDVGTDDNGVVINSYATWGDIFASGKPSVRSKWPWIELKGTTGNSGQTVQIDVYPDGSDATQSSISTTTILASTQTTWGTGGLGGTMVWGQSKWAKSGIQTVQKDLGLDAKALRVRLSNSIKGNTATIEGFAVSVIPQGVSQI